MNVYEKLTNIQNELKAPKSQYNSFGKYNYRNCEDIQEAVKPLLKKYKSALTLSDTIELVGDRYYIKATATFVDCEGDSSLITNTAYAREEESKKGMDASQVTGSTSSYARKYALNGLFAIDDTKDADSFDNSQKQVAPKIEYKCEKCGTLFKAFRWKDKDYTAKDGFEISKRKNGIALCNACAKEHRNV